MGQGEPFLNYDNFMKAVRLLVEGVGVAESRMTVSTSGILPRIADFGREPVRPKLAISLNGSNDEGRSRVMPVNRKWNIASLLEAAQNFPLRPRERITFEYVLLGGENDSVENARRAGGAAARTARQGQPDRAQCRAGHRVFHARRGAGTGFSEGTGCAPEFRHLSGVHGGATFTPLAVN